MLMAQYTIRNVPEAVDRKLRDRAKRSGQSLNDAAVEAMTRGLGISRVDHVYDDLDDLAGTWKPDDAFDQAMQDQDSVDPDAWR